jgi:PKHD-type hydroxylase
VVHQLSGVLGAEDVAELVKLAGDLDEFEDGASTAGRAAAQVKRNRQMSPGPRADLIRRKADAALNAHAGFKSAALPKRILRTVINRYEPGDGYGLHVDDAIMGGARSDLSFTLFLSAPDAYEGGELVLHDSAGASEIKLAAGDAVLYPTGALHEVRTVSSGSRLCVVGWVRSLVRRADQREVLFDLSLTANALLEGSGKTDAYDRVAKTRSNLLRMWAQD